ncbi:MAG TPA: MerR family transcriptional regulator [Thermomicrobiales bacterium]|jgi:DNA-binding transcriptional MerR regulator|nr:MerR family transcriptional regulator [Thermomicrobiales bacterium]
MAGFDDDVPRRPPLRDERPIPRGRPMSASTRRYDINELEEETGIPARTVRYYISRGLLAPAYGRGPSATYDVGHLLRLRLIARMKAERRPLEEIRDRLGELTDDEVEAELGIHVPLPSDAWRRITLHPDIELHVRIHPGTDIDPDFNAAVELIVGLARPVIDRLEDEPGRRRA